MCTIFDVERNVTQISSVLLNKVFQLPCLYPDLREINGEALGDFNYLFSLPFRTTTAGIFSVP